MNWDEKLKLEAIAGEYDPSSPELEFDYWFVRLGFETLAKFLRGGGAVLELGCSTGLMTSLLAAVADRLIVVEGSWANIEKSARRVHSAAHVAFHHCLWEEFETGEKFDDVVLAGALEHVVDPVGLLSQTRCYLAPRGRAHIIVPNARSLHRRVGKQMGLLDSTHDLNESDQRIGHRRVYDRDSLFEHIHLAGMKVLHWEGILLKPLSNAQMRPWAEPLVRAFYELGRELPDFCGEIYACCTMGERSVVEVEERQ